ncbi:conserved hypothetical protein [Ricinus communis]|uniref:Uncharacterized protein n=1 Tax=Ricinus communis TaxID=3988 RepID=B9TKP1_RICCO|nr:conserved hypothetical protein [Ricinus communis]
MPRIDRQHRTIQAARRDAPAAARRIARQPLQRVSHDDPVPGGLDPVARRLPHHAGPQARVTERFQQCLRRHAVVGPPAQAERTFHAVEYRGAQGQPLDALGRPIRGNLVARHAPHLFGIGLEKDREQAGAELVDDPVLEIPHRLPGKQSGPGEARHAQGRAHGTQFPQRIEGAQGVIVELFFVVDPAHPRALDESLGQDVIPQVDDFLRFRKKAMSADIEPESVVLDRPADTTHMPGILFDDDDAESLLSEQVGRREPGGSGPYDRNVGMMIGSAHASSGPRSVGWPPGFVRQRH